MEWTRELESRLERQARSGLGRRLKPRLGVDFCSNDYLGFSEDPELAHGLAEAIAAHPLGAAGSRLIRGVQKRIADEHINAEAAVLKEIGLMTEAFASMEDPYLSARTADIRDVGRRLVASLSEDAPDEKRSLPSNAIIIADELFEI